MNAISTKTVRYSRSPGDPLCAHVKTELAALRMKPDHEIDYSDAPELRSGRWVRVSAYPTVAEAKTAARAAATNRDKVETRAALDVKAIRENLHLTQDRFSQMFGLSLDSIRNWEAGRRVPESAARILLAVIAHNPEVVIQALGSMVSLATAPDTPAKRGRPRKQKMSV